MKTSILVVEDEENLRHMLRVMLEKQGYGVEEAVNGSEGLQKAVQGNFDFILSDIRMPVMDGPEFLRQLSAARVAATIIMMSAYGTVETAVECMKLGAYDYVSKPFKNDEILLVLKNAEERRRLTAENKRLREEIRREYSFANIVSKNPRMVGIFALIGKVCDYKTTVLILGESGTGKELIARAIHYGSIRNSAPFVAVNCGAIPESLLESELFGHVQGAFTDACADKAGLFEQANGGTLFLDEIGDMPLSLQTKILRVLQESEIRRIGSSVVKQVDVRVVSATSKDLQQEVAEGRFREDLFFRLNVFSIKLPPLRERPEDIPLLATHFLAKFGEKFHRPEAGCTPEVVKLLMNYSWPGNVRELENAIERGLILCEGDILTPDCLPDSLRKTQPAGWGNIVPGDNLSIKQAEEMLERDFIRRALEKTGGNRTQAAKLLEISHRALLYKLKEYEMD